MNVALIIAAGSGKRMNQDIPKQFINVYDKPVLIYTLESFQRHPEIDAIEVVCLDGWHDILRAYAKQYNISKLQWILSGGMTGQESIRNGVYYLEAFCSQYDMPNPAYQNGRPAAWKPAEAVLAEYILLSNTRPLL